MDKAPALRAALRRAAEGGPTVVGGHIFFSEACLSEAMAAFGYDFVWIDAEHGAMDRHTVLEHVRAVNAGGSAAVVRVTANDPALIKPVLEMGPDGVIVPNVCTAEEAARAVAACRYPPAGIRGFGPRRAIRYGAIPAEDYLRDADASILKIVQIEHVEAVRNLPAILATEGLDAVIIGPNDLSGSIGKLGRLDDPAVADLYDRIIAEARRARVPCGASIGPGDQAVISEWIRRGVDFLSCGDELAFMATGAARTIGFIKAGFEARSSRR